MRRLNPLYILGLLATIVFISFFILNNKKQELLEKSSEYNNIKEKAVNYRDLKSKWENKSFVKSTIDKLTKSSKFKNEKFLVAEVNNVLKVKMESKKPKILEEFLNKILNKPLILNKIDIKKNSISLELGIK